MARIKFAIIGCGRISYKHIEALENHKDTVEIVSVCDINRERAEEKGLLLGCSYYVDYNKMIDSEDVDVVAICTPSGLHPSIGIDCASRGIHVISEKPMAVNLESADALINACERNHVKLFVVKQNRLNTTVKLVKQAIDNGRFGKVYISNTNVYWTRPQSYYDMAKWRGTWSLDGGAFLNQASHYVDMLIHFFGNVYSVYALTDTLRGI